MPTLNALRDDLTAWGHLSSAYRAKQVHPVPDAPRVDRCAYILDWVRGRRVLEFGASGPMHEAIVREASFAVGVDRQDDHRDGCGSACVHGCVIGFDMDDVSRAGLPGLMPERIVCGEVLEHLSNPGWFVTRLHRQFPDVPVLITVPNAHSTLSFKWLARGVENVNADHVSWHSYRTIATLVERAGYVPELVGWYQGPPLVSEGLIVMAR